MFFRTASPQLPCFLGSALRARVSSAAFLPISSVRSIRLFMMVSMLALFATCCSLLCLNSSLNPCIVSFRGAKSISTFSRFEAFNFSCCSLRWRSERFSNSCLSVWSFSSHCFSISAMLRSYCNSEALRFSSCCLLSCSTIFAQEFSLASSFACNAAIFSLSAVSSLLLVTESSSNLFFHELPFFQSLIIMTARIAIITIVYISIVLLQLLSWYLPIVMECILICWYVWERYAYLMMLLLCITHNGKIVYNSY